MIKFKVNIDDILLYDDGKCPPIVVIKASKSNFIDDCANTAFPLPENKEEMAMAFTASLNSLMQFMHKDEYK